MIKKISPSLMCAHVKDYAAVLKAFDIAKIEYLHIDVMDGEFVPNLQFGTDTVKQLRQMTNIPLDIHLMIQNPEEKLAWFHIQEGEYVSIHYEATRHVQRCLSRIREAGGKPMLALNPATPLCMIEDVIDDCDAILLMTVNPGFAGQKIIPATIEKVRRLRQMLDTRGYGHVEIEVDGNVSFENARLLSAAGANIFVAGTSSVFTRTLPLETAIEHLRSSISIQ